MRIIDAHQHFWDLEIHRHPWLCNPKPIPFRYGDYASLKRNYLPQEFKKDSAGLDVIGTVHVEAEIEPESAVEETRWLHELSREHRYPNAIVCQARLDSDDVDEVLGAQAAFSLVRGVRHKPAAASSPAQVIQGAPGSMGDPNWRAGFARLEHYGFSFDLQTPWWHLAEAADLAQDHPRIPIIINHTGLPVDRSKEGLAGWRRALETVAVNFNVAIKISGLGQPGKAWTVDLQKEVVLDTIEIFGTERCMFASNYPVDRLVTTYRALYEGYLEITSPFSKEVRDRLFQQNALEWYRINL